MKKELGLGTALAQHLEAMEYYACLPPESRRLIQEHTPEIPSQSEMRAYVESRTGSLEKR